MNDATGLTSIPLAKASAALRGGKHGALVKLAFGSISARAARTLTTGGIDPGRHLAFLPTDTLDLDLSDPAQRRFGDYELLEAIGEGGMGVVYRARQISLDREVAVKLLSAGPWASSDFVERFQHEAQNAARMQHPNIVAIHEVGATEGLHFFSMRLIRGSSLAQQIRDGTKLTPQRAAALLRTIAEAVDYAHRLGVLHLDLKPANVLLDERGEPHVADFGLSRRLDQALAADNVEISGTPSYMAPEQATTGVKIAATTDIWGLGAIGYELMTGEPPFRSDNAKATLKLVLGGTLRSPRHHTPTLPGDLEAVILKCLSREPAQRYPTARALADDLQRFVEGRPVRARPLNVLQRAGRWARREPTIAVLALLALATLIGGMIGISVQWQRAQANARQAQTNAQGATQSANLANERLWQARIDQVEGMARDGHNYRALPGLVANITEREAQGLDAREDRVRVAMVERTAPRLIDSLALGSEIRGIAISPDGASVAVSTLDEKLRLIDALSGKERWQTGFHDATRFLPKFFETPVKLAFLRFTPDGRYLIGRHLVKKEEFPAPAGLDEVMFDAADGRLITPQQRVPDFTDVTYSPDGEFAVVRRAGGREAVFMRTRDWRALGTPSAGAPQRFWLATAGGRHVVTYMSGELQISEPGTLTVRHVIKYEPSQALTSWVSTPAGDGFIAGHLDGMIERIDCASGRRERITPSPIGRIGWVAFSLDGRWFGAVADIGEVLVWDSTTLKLVAPPMRLNPTSGWHLDQLFIDAGARTVIAAADHEMALWSVRGPHEAIRLSGEFPIFDAPPPPHAAFAHHAAQGLIATDAGQGELQLWRVQRSAPEGMRGPPMAPMDLRTEEGRVVEVHDEGVLVVDAASGQPLSPLLRLPQAAMAAELTTDGKSLVAVAGNQVPVYDAATWTPRRASITLPNDPADLLLNPDSRHVLLRFADYRDGRSVELAQVWDFFDGGPSSAEGTLDPRARLRFSPDGRNLVSWVRDGLQVLDAATLAPRWPGIAVGKLLVNAGGDPGKGEMPPQEVVIEDVHFSSDGSRVEALTVTTGAGLTLWWEFDASSGAELRRTKLSETGMDDMRFAVLPERDAVIVQRESGPLWWDSVSGATELPGEPGPIPGAVVLAPDASLFAHTTTTHVMLTSTHRLTWLSPPLPVALATKGDSPTHLGFTRDGRGLIARSDQGALSYWDVSPDLRPIAQLARESELLNRDPAKVEGGLAPALTDAERQLLRANDPGAPAPPASTVSAGYPPRRADTPANLFDLGAFYNFSIGQGQNQYHVSTYELTPGRHRFLGVDYDARGAIVLAVKGFGPAVSPQHPVPSVVRDIVPGIPRFAALNILITGNGMLVSHQEHPYAFIDLEYVDGSRERIAIVYRREVDEMWGERAAQAGARVAWRARKPTYQIFHVRCANPHPERSVRSIAIAAADEQFSVPMIFAITAEPIPVSHVVSVTPGSVLERDSAAEGQPP